MKKEDLGTSVSIFGRALLESLPIHYLLSAIRFSHLSYAKIIMATTGITRIRVLVTHQIEFPS